MFRFIGKTLFMTGSAGLACYTYRSWDTNKRRSCEQFESDIIHCLSPSMTDSNSPISKLWRAIRGGTDN
jgi:hypothetical protein